MKHILSFRHPGIVVSNMEKSKKFYCDYLEHQVIVDFIEKGDYFNKLIGLKDLKARVLKVNSPDGIFLELLEFIDIKVPKRKTDSFIGSIGCNHICFNVNDIEGLYKKLSKNDVEFISPPLASDFDPVKTCFCYDPDRNLIQFVEIKDREKMREGLK